MDMRAYAFLVVPIVILTYGTFVLFMHPPFKVIGATLAGGLVVALLNICGDLAAISTSLWHYNATGLIDQLPLPLYTTQIFILGGLAYLLIWRLWHGPRHQFAVALLIGVPALGFLRDLWQGELSTQGSFLIWQHPLAWLADIVLWLIMFFGGYLVFRLLAPARTDETKAKATPA